MPTTPADAIRSIEDGDVPSVILVGGDNEFLTEQTFLAIRDRIVQSDPTYQLQSFGEATDLGLILDSFGTMSLFDGKRLLLVPEINAFVTKKEVVSLYEKSISDWKSAKSERKRASSMAKMLHLLGLVGADLDDPDVAIAEAIGQRKVEKALLEILEAARVGGKHATRGEGDAALLAEAVSRGGAPGAVLLMRSGEVPTDSATVAAIERHGMVVVCNLTREEIPRVLEESIQAMAGDHGVTFDRSAVAALRQRMGIDRVLGDRFSRDLPDLRLVLSEAERLATFAGEGGRVTGAMVSQQIESLAGGARYEFASLFAEGKAVEAVGKLRDLISQARREDPKSSPEIQYGKYLFPLADELRQLIAIQSFARMRRIDLRQSIAYNRFRDVFAEPLGEYLKECGLVRQKPHPFALHKKFEAAKNYRQEILFGALDRVAELDFQRKSGGISAELGIELLVLDAAS